MVFATGYEPKLIENSGHGAEWSAIRGQEFGGLKTFCFTMILSKTIVGGGKTLVFSYVFQARLVGERPVSVKPWFSWQYVD